MKYWLRKRAVAKEFIAVNPVDRWKELQPRGRAASRSKPFAAANVLDSGERERLLQVAKQMEPEYFPFVLFLAETGCRISEAIALRWADIDLDSGTATVVRHKTGGSADEVLLSSRLRRVLRQSLPDIAPCDAPAFPTPHGFLIRYFNFRRRVWSPIVREAFGENRRFTPHGLRHTWAPFT